MFAAFLCDANAASSFDGHWFSCDGKSGEFQSLIVEQVNGLYKGVLESSRNGGVYSAELTGSVREGALVLHGCQAYRGEASKDCALPIEIKLGKRDSSFKYISPSQQERSIAKCRALRKES